MLKKTNSIVSNPPFPKNYSDEFLIIDRGDGVYLKDKTGKSYLDFGAGIAVNALGYGNNKIAETAYKQMQKLIHISNLFTTEPALELAEKLTAMGNFASVHFGNSGSEANETALKYARLYSLRTKGEGNNKFLCFKNSFHGRTFGALSCTPCSKYQDPFKPLVPGVEVADYNDTALLNKVLDRSFAGVIVEVVQGEGGLNLMLPDFAEALNKLCRKHEVILIADEVQTGLGRTGYPFASNMTGLDPDIITLSKPLAGGLPLSATLLPEKVNDLIKTGEHGTTFGGGPVTCAVASYVIDTILTPDFLKSVKRKGEFLHRELLQLKEKYMIVKDVRGAGLLKGIAIEDKKDKNAETIGTIIKKAIKEGLILLRSGENVLRIAPPLIINEKEIKTGINIIDKILSEY